MAAEFLPLLDPVVAARYYAELAGWVYDTGREHFDWLFGGANRAQERLQAWVRRPNSQFAAVRGKLLLVDGQPAGGTIGFPGDEAPGRQRADFLDLIKSCKSDERAGLMQRLPLMQEMEAPVEPTDLYLRTVAIAPAHRGHGLGRLLLEQSVADRIAAGLKRLRLDVRIDNVPAVRLYQRFGFRTIREAAAGHLGENCRVASMVYEL